MKFVVREVIEHDSPMIRSTIDGARFFQGDHEITVAIVRALSAEARGNEVAGVAIGEQPEIVRTTVGNHAHGIIIDGGLLQMVYELDRTEARKRDIIAHLGSLIVHEMGHLADFEATAHNAAGSLDHIQTPCRNNEGLMCPSIDLTVSYAQSRATIQQSRASARACRVLYETDTLDDDDISGLSVESGVSAAECVLSW